MLSAFVYLPHQISGIRYLGYFVEGLWLSGPALGLEPIERFPFSLHRRNQYDG